MFREAVQLLKQALLIASRKARIGTKKQPFPALFYFIFYDGFIVFSTPLT
jgi:uncharacterized membrane protein